MSWAGNQVYLSTPEEIFLFDTALVRNNAPGLPGEERQCYVELESGELVLQWRRLVRNLTTI